MIKNTNFCLIRGIFIALATATAPNGTIRLKLKS